MLRKLSIRRKMITGILIGCLMPLAIGSFYIRNQTEKWLYQNYVDHTSLILQQSAEHVDESIIKVMQNIISMLVMDERIINVSSDISSYVNFDPNTFQAKKSKSEEEITALFKSLAETQETITFVSYGTENGGYIEYPKFYPSGSYDPRVRAWYINAMTTDDTVISEPYQTQVSKELVICIVKKVMRDSQKIGVVGLTIGLDNIMKDISEIPFNKTGHIFILSPDDVFINCPQHDSWLMKSIDELQLKVFKGIDRYNGKSFEGKLDGEDKVFTVYISPASGWKYISILDRSVVLEQSRALSTMLSFIFVITVVIITILVLTISRKITTPIVKLTQIIKKMASFQFDDYEQKDLKEYTMYHDEIGEISRALNGMQENFLELKNKVDIMDEEIKSINIDDKDVHQLNLSKDNPFAGIAVSVNGLLIRVYSYIRQIKKYTDEIHFLAEHDHLTNLPNRRSFHEQLRRELLSGAKGAVLLLDMDNFKSINDSLGHIFGDKVLQYVSGKLESTMSQSVTVSRFGGDEFLILYKFDISGPSDLSEYISKIFDLLREPIVIDENEIKIEFSMGVSVFPEHSSNIDQLIMYADLALYFVKNNGKNHFAFFDNTMADHLKIKLDHKRILVHVIENDGFRMVYQPQVNLKSGRIAGYESLVRLKEHRVSTADFITAAEENGLIIPLGRMITKLVIEQMSVWNHMGLPPKPVAINFSVLQLNDKGFKDFLLDMLSAYDVKPQYITIEITEHIFLEKKEAAIDFINDLKAYGIRFTIDDFGAEYSSLSYLAALPIDTLKLDRELNHKFLDFENPKVMESLINFIHSLNKDVIAEGIEEFSHVKKLIKSNCDSIQGFYFSKPLEAENVPKYYHKIYKVMQ